MPMGQQALRQAVSPRGGSCAAFSIEHVGSCRLSIMIKDEKYRPSPLHHTYTLRSSVSIWLLLDIACVMHFLGGPGMQPDLC